MPNDARVALITGCGKPVGIGNSTARALAAAGVTVVVSDVSPAGVANEHNVQGDMDPDWTGIDSLVRAIVEGRRHCIGHPGRCQRRGGCRAHGGRGAAPLRSARYPGEQCRCAPGCRSQRDRGCPGRRVGPHDGRQRARLLPDVARRRAGDAQGGVGPHRQRLVARGVPAGCEAHATYAASKAAIVGFTKSLAFDLAPCGITVNAVLPGPIRTSRAISTNRREFGDDLEVGFAERAKAIPRRPLRQSGRGGVDDRLSRLRRRRVRHRSGDRGRRRLVRRGSSHG